MTNYLNGNYFAQTLTISNKIKTNMLTSTETPSTFEIKLNTHI